MVFVGIHLLGNCCWEDGEWQTGMSLMWILESMCFQQGNWMGVTQNNFQCKLLVLAVFLSLGSTEFMLILYMFSAP
jgi:hypothetical protein